MNGHQIGSQGAQACRRVGRASDGSRQEMPGSARGRRLRGPGISGGSKFVSARFLVGIFDSVYLVALTAWVGSILFFLFGVAPLIFRVLSAEDASRFVRALFPRYYMLGCDRRRDRPARFRGRPALLSGIPRAGHRHPVPDHPRLHPGDVVCGQLADSRLEYRERCRHRRPRAVPAAPSTMGATQCARARGWPWPADRPREPAGTRTSGIPQLSPGELARVDAELGSGDRAGGDEVRISALARRARASPRSLPAPSWIPT